MDAYGIMASNCKLKMQNPCSKVENLQRINPAIIKVHKVTVLDHKALVLGDTRLGMHITIPTLWYHDIL